MHLLHVGTNNELTLAKDLVGDIPPYAILSHTWGGLDDEVTFRDMEENTGRNKPGYRKILFCANQARRDNLEYFWVDTCCIDKRNSTELNESINSMFQWYRNAKICYVYLVDVSIDECDSTSSEVSRAAWQEQFQRSRWLSRGWTLQELLAPRDVRFYDRNGFLLGDKATLKDEISKITRIAETALLGTALAGFTVSERYDWARSRQTTREEDWAYSLQGIFDVFFLPMYGEGRLNAVRRLVKKIKKAVLGDNTQSFIIDRNGRGQIVNPLFLDIALLQTMSLFDEARVQDDRLRSRVRNNTTTLSNNRVLVSDTVSTFITFLRGLLRYVLMPSGPLADLNRQLDFTYLTLRSIVDLNRKIASDLQHEEENGQKTLKKLRTAQDLIQAQVGVPHAGHRVITEPQARQDLEILKEYIGCTTLEMEETPETHTQKASPTLESDEGVSELRERFANLRDECKLRVKELELAVGQVKTLRDRVDDEIDTLEKKLQEAERMRRDWENKTVWQKIWAWIVWLGSCGD